MIKEIFAAISGVAIVAVAARQRRHRVPHGNFSRRPVRGETYHVVEFADHQETAAFIAALSRFLASPAAADAIASLPPVEVWTSMERSRVRLFLNASAYAGAVAAFSPVPVAGTIPGEQIPRRTALMMGGTGSIGVSL